ncbi:CD3324 family protein [Schinkia azotoformans]|uniref:Helix-turn-helix domain of resolvase n=1 Tax=Schinkia azotoformans LMG 9581 TaxID=1131731 RepID=K6D8P0_SCHAZ|nr:CD3324 family protein [Schinkia azotoformans]EKN68902.1 Helix-turn-helix domain of resolvase [Schinkia azotoformans LMG 9581]MEC1641024.1 CD3324 family protein [Schinkia azotoformans]MEC1720121.1 CD3324 family protein [Schinkia azotoformans]MEC1944085.1 CD3324 family protein [Schinkia azotoformans]MED4354280.1 CD3324 family protein [Schinkia azotoformans]
MNYVKATAVLPQELIKEIQKYVQGETIYIPKPEGSHQKWGTRSGARQLIAERNDRIKHDFRNGMSIAELADEYFLSTESIKKIVYSTK